MQLDAFIPNYDITLKHSIRIEASASNVYRAMKEIRFQDFSPVVNMLFALRALPERLFKTDYPDITNKDNYKSNDPFFEQLFSRGFVILADNDELELVFGLIVPGEIGRFWKKSADTLREVNSPEEFMEFNHPDYVKVVSNFLISATDTDGFVSLSTESRIEPLSLRAKKKFTPYWRVIHPGSSLIRYFWLRAIKHRAEKY